MWFERFVIIVTSLAKEYEPWQWAQYKPSWVEMAILAGSRTAEPGSSAPAGWPVAMAHAAVFVR